VAVTRDGSKKKLIVLKEIKLKSVLPGLSRYKGISRKNNNGIKGRSAGEEKTYIAGAISKARAKNYIFGGTKKSRQTDQFLDLGDQVLKTPGTSGTI